MTDAQTFVADLSDTWSIGSRLKLPGRTINANEYAVGVYGAVRTVPHSQGAAWQFPDKSTAFITISGTRCTVLEESC